MSNPQPILNTALLYTTDVNTKHALIAELLSYASHLSRSNQVTSRNFIYLARLVVDPVYRELNTVQRMTTGTGWRNNILGYDHRLIFGTKEGIIKHLKRLAHPQTDEEDEMSNSAQYKLLRRLYIADPSKPLPL